MTRAQLAAALGRGQGRVRQARPRDCSRKLLPLPMPVRLMGLTLSNLEGEDGDEERPPDYRAAVAALGHSPANLPQPADRAS